MRRVRPAHARRAAAATWSPASARGFLLEGDLDRDAAPSGSPTELLVDPLVETGDAAATVGGATPDTATRCCSSPASWTRSPQSVLDAAADLGHAARRPSAPSAATSARRRSRRADRDVLFRKVLANDAIEQVVVGPLNAEHLALGTPYTFKLVTVPLRDARRRRAGEAQQATGSSRSALDEMRAIQAHFRELGREPTDVELETIAQTWSEHCSHKTLKGTIEFTDTTTGETRTYDNLLKETIFAATQDDPPAARRGRLVRQRLRGQRRRRPVRRRVRRLLQGRDAQSPVGDRAVRRGEHRPRRRDPRPARHRPRREADLQHRRLLRRPARLRRRSSCRRACCTRGG